VSLFKVRNCPICGFRSSSLVFPYETKFNGEKYQYLRCCDCLTVFVDPVPDKHAFVKMYAKNTYHDKNYDIDVNGAYLESVQLLQSYVSAGKTVLDYGCGVGGFLKELGNNGFIPFGVEYDLDAVEFASNICSCKVWTTDDFLKILLEQKFDAIHLGDVLEHLPEPVDVIDEILISIKSGGVLFVEGPLETNSSLVHFSANFFGWVKRKFHINTSENNPPYHLIRVNSKQQLEFFNQIKTPVHLEYWRVYETGWPYIGGGIIKKIIAKSAIYFGGKTIFGTVFGNRFQAILIKK
jgi:2-polyprenyl-3-methyl-5-hydroxy-6-metoxy-1,4-benzoquinol methylase